MTNMTWSTIKFPREFVAEMASLSKDNGWRSSSEFIMAAARYVQKYQIDLHGEDSFFHQTVATQLIYSLEKTSKALSEFPEKIELIQRVNELELNLSASQDNLEQCNKAFAAWKKAALSLKAEKETSQVEMEKMKSEVSTLTEQAKKLDTLLQAIHQKVNQSLYEIENENSMFGKEGKRLGIALVTLRWIVSDVPQSVPDPNK